MLVYLVLHKLKLGSYLQRASNNDEDDEENREIGDEVEYRPNQISEPKKQKGEAKDFKEVLENYSGQLPFEHRYIDEKLAVKEKREAYDPSFL